MLSAKSHGDARQNVATPSSVGEATLLLTPKEEAAKKKACREKAFFAGILFAFVAYVIADFLTTHVADAVESFLEWIETNPAVGIFVFMLMYFVATVLFIPGSILTLGAGFVFANAGAVAAFFIGRYLHRDWVGNLSQKHAIFQALDVAFESKGLRIMTLLRLSPVIPSNAINYVAGVTSLRFYQYAIALIAILPGSTLHVFLGASAGSQCQQRR